MCIRNEKQKGNNKRKIQIENCNTEFTIFSKHGSLENWILQIRAHIIHMPYHSALSACLSIHGPRHVRLAALLLWKGRVYSRGHFAIKETNVWTNNWKKIIKNTFNQLCRKHFVKLSIFIFRLVKSFEISVTNHYIKLIISHQSRCWDKHRHLKVLNRR